MQKCRIITGDCREVLKTLPDESVHCVVTSPPYWGLRDYGTARWEGGDPTCDHDQRRFPTDNSKQTTSAGSSRDSLAGRTLCRKCGAKRIDNQIGLETSPNDYVTVMVSVFREVRRVLRSDGTVWLNLGDSYSGSGKGGNPEAGMQSSNKGSQSIGTLYGSDDPQRAKALNVAANCGIPSKNLIGIPWRVALALQADGWYLRQDIIWSKPNAMPESVRDRCTKAHEYVFLLTKSSEYYYNADAIAERATTGANESTFTSGKTLGHQQNRTSLKPRVGSEFRNKRSVWEINTAPTKESHFATMPRKLARLCITAGCQPKGTVLDPFGGIGTTAMVAAMWGRDSVLIELNPEYALMANRRIHNRMSLFCKVVLQDA